MFWFRYNRCKKKDVLLLTEEDGPSLDHVVFFKANQRRYVPI